MKAESPSRLLQQALQRDMALPLVLLLLCHKTTWEEKDLTDRRSLSPTAALRHGGGFLCWCAAAWREAEL